MVLGILSLAAFVGLASALANQLAFVVQAKLYHKTPIELSYSVRISQHLRWNGIYPHTFTSSDNDGSFFQGLSCRGRHFSRTASYRTSCAKGRPLLDDLLVSDLVNSLLYLVRRDDEE